MNSPILVVDDDASMRETMQQALEAEGYSVVLAESAEEALDRLQETSCQVQFIDLQLPGMTGLDFCRKVHADNPVAILIAMTGYVSVFHLVECREAGFDDYFVKPLKLPVILEAARQSFERIERWRRGK